MLIKPSASLRNDYDKIVSLSKTEQEPVCITRNGEGEMVFCQSMHMNAVRPAALAGKVADGGTESIGWCAYLYFGGS